MFGSIGLALGALSTVSSLIDSTVSSIGPASVAKASLASAHLNPGPPIPKFDKHTHAHLLALQEQQAA